MGLIIHMHICMYFSRDVASKVYYMYINYVLIFLITVGAKYSVAIGMILKCP